jgi:hypothetical protein
MVSITPRPRFTPGKRAPGTHCIGAGWAPELVWTQRLEEKSSASVGDPTPTVQAVVRHYTDWATRLLLSARTADFLDRGSNTGFPTNQRLLTWCSLRKILRSYVKRWVQKVTMQWWPNGTKEPNQENKGEKIIDWLARTLRAPCSDCITPPCFGWHLTGRWTWNWTRATQIRSILLNEWGLSLGSNPQVTEEIRRSKLQA